MINKWLSAVELANLLLVSDRWIRERADREHWQRRVCDGNGGKQYRYRLTSLPLDVQTAYAVSIKLSLKELQTQLKPVLKPEPKGKIARYNGRSQIKESVKIFDKCTEAERGIALLRKQIIDAYDGSGLPMLEFIQHYEAGVILPEVKVRLGRWGRLHSPSTFYSHWLGRYAKFGIEGLVPQYKDERGGTGKTFSQEIKDRIEWLYFDTAKPSVKQVVRYLPQYGININESIVYRYLNTIPQSVTDYYRKGKTFFENKYEPYIVRDYTKYKPMEIIVGDYMTQDVLCRIGDRILRAKVVAFQDMRTRTIVGWSLQESANSIGVVTALKMCFEKYGLPGTIYFDNGKEFKNYWICGDEWKIRHTKIDKESFEQDAGLLNEVGVKMSFCKVRHGQSKPIERTWGTTHNIFEKPFETYFGSNTSERPDEIQLYYRNVEGIKKHDITQIITFEQMSEKLGNFFEWYNNCWNHSGQGMDNKTPKLVWNENPVEKRLIPENIKKYLFTLRYQKVIQKNGILLDGGWYYCKDIILKYIGQKVEVRVPLDFTDTIHVFSLPERKYLFDAVFIEQTGDVAKDNEMIGKLRKGKKILLSQYNKQKKEFDGGEFKTPAEIYAQENQPFIKALRKKQKAAEETREVVGGEPLATIKKRKLVGIFD